MERDTKFFDDMARVAGGALNVLSGLKAEVEALVCQQMEAFVVSMKLVKREEFEAVQAMAAKAREEQERLAERLAILEADLAESKATDADKARKARKPRSADDTDKE